MFKPSTVLIQSDVNGGNDNLFDAVQDYLFQSFNKNKNLLDKEFQIKKENLKEVVDENENENKVSSQIENERKSNQNKIFFKKKLPTLFGKRNGGEMININKFEDHADLNKNKKRKILSVNNLSRCVKKIKQEINEKNDEKIILGNDKMQIDNSNSDENSDSCSKDVNIGNDDATNDSNENNDNEYNNIDNNEYNNIDNNEYDNIDNNNDRSSDDIHHGTEHTFEDKESDSLGTHEARKNNKAGASAELYLIHRYVRYCGSPTYPVMFIALRVLHIAYYPFFSFQSLINSSPFSFSFPSSLSSSSFSSSPSSSSSSSSPSLFPLLLLYLLLLLLLLHLLLLLLLFSLSFFFFFFFYFFFYFFFFFFYYFFFIFFFFFFSFFFTFTTSTPSSNLPSA